jgi:hypothetical protein
VSPFTTPFTTTLTVVRELGLQLGLGIQSTSTSKKKVVKTYVSSIVGVHVNHLLIFQIYTKMSSIHD